METGRTETMTKHMPGPWKWDESWGAIVTDHNNPYRLISPVWTGCNPRGIGPEAEAEDAANARLIAAAPDLLAVCMEIAEHGADDWDARMKTLRAAIAKATA